MRVSFIKATGEPLEMQVSARAGTVLSNALLHGYDATEVEEREVSLEEWVAIREEWFDKPKRAATEERENKRLEAEATIRTRLAFSDDEWAMLKEALGTNP